MVERTAVVASRVGLHARPAATFVKAAAGSGIPVTIAKEGSDPVDATSVLAVMTLGAKHGEQVTLQAEGEQAEQVLEDLVQLIESDQDG